MGCEEAELIDNTNRKFMEQPEVRWMALPGSVLLIGKNKILRGERIS
jgi:hypothetical protein